MCVCVCFIAFCSWSSLEHSKTPFSPSSFEATSPFSLRGSLAPLATYQILGLLILHFEVSPTAYSANLCSSSLSVSGCRWIQLQQIPVVFRICATLVDSGMVWHILYWTLLGNSLFGHLCLVVVLSGDSCLWSYPAVATVGFKGFSRRGHQYGV